MKIKNWALPIVLFAVFWGGIGLSMAADVWNTKMSESNLQVTSMKDLKGWMTLENVSEHTNIPVSELIKLFGLPENTGHNKTLKQIAEGKGVEVEEFRAVLGRYMESGKGGVSPVSGTTVKSNHD